MTGNWDFSQYNEIVKHVERCADVLRDVAVGIEPYTRTRIPRRLLKHLQTAARDLDKRAIHMLALYDGAAREMVKDGVTYDKRRDLFKPKTINPSMSSASKPTRSAVSGEAKTK